MLCTGFLNKGLNIPLPHQLKLLQGRFASTTLSQADWILLSLFVVTSLFLPHSLEGKYSTHCPISLMKWISTNNMYLWYWKKSNYCSSNKRWCYEEPLIGWGIWPFCLNPVLFSVKYFQCIIWDAHLSPFTPG